MAQAGSAAERGRFLLHRTGRPGIVAVDAASRHRFPRHMHDQFGIGALIAGAQHSHSGRGRVEAQAGDAITVNPGEVHDGAPLGSVGRVWRMIYFDPPVIAAALADHDSGATGRELPEPVIRDRRISSRLQALFLALTEPESAAIRSEEALLLLLDAALRRDAERPIRVARGVPRAIARARQRLDDDPAGPVALADLAGECGLSRYQLLRGFSRATGLTPHAYLMQRRLVLARGLIAVGLPLAEAAVAAGFADQSHMTRLFSRTFGMPPGAYARAVR